MIRRQDEGRYVGPPKGYGWMCGRTLDEIDEVREKLGKNITQIAEEVNAGRLDVSATFPRKSVVAPKKTSIIDDEPLLKSLGIGNGMLNMKKTRV